MQSLFVFGEINKYLDTQIIEIEAQPFWNPDNQEIKFHNLAHVLELSSYPLDGLFEDMEEFQMYKTLCFMLIIKINNLINWYISEAYMKSNVNYRCCAHRLGNGAFHLIQSVLILSPGL